jgi:hypothetical protein
LVFVKRLTGLFFGAGASYEAGMPLAKDLTTEIKGWLTADKLRQLNDGWRLQGDGCSDQVINDCIVMLEHPSVHYEAILGYLETQQRRQQDNKVLQDYHGLYSWLVQLVSLLLTYRQVNNPLVIGKALRYYEGLRVLADANIPLWIFSLNHDVIVEMIAARYAIPLHTGFSESTVTFPRRDAAGHIKGRVQGQVLRKQEFENYAMNFPNPAKLGIYLLKIHGALDIFTFNDGEDLVKLIPDGPGENGIMDVLRAANEDLFYPLRGFPGGRVNITTNEICYMDEEGDMQFLRRTLLAGAYKFDPRMPKVLPQRMLKHFRENLNFVSNLVCIGYGFGDSHINTTIRQWLQFTTHRHLEIVAPVDQPIPAELLHLAPQVTITKSTATDYLDRAAGIVRSKTEKLEKQLASTLQARGKQSAQAALASFARESQAELTHAFVKKLSQLPLISGKRDFSALGDPHEVAKQWAAELKLNPDQVVERLLQHLGVNSSE